MPEGKSITPEKQLLRLIEDQKGKSNPKIQTGAISHFGLSLFSLTAWLGRVSFLKDRFRGGFSIDKFSLLDIKIINSLLILCIFVLVVYLINNFYTSAASLKKTPGLELKASGEIKSLGLQEGSILKKAASYYLEKIALRDIFRRGAKSMSGAATKGPSEKAIEATQSFKLVGISWSDNPDAMIEDTKAFKTFFVKRGTMIGEVKVEAIFRDKVVLSYKGEEVELK